MAGVTCDGIDPTKEKAAAVLSMDAALSSLKRECVEKGPDYKEVQHQRATEIRLMKELGLTLPDCPEASRWPKPAKLTNHHGRTDTRSGRATRRRRTRSSI
jgi:capsid protein